MLIQLKNMFLPDFPSVNLNAVLVILLFLAVGNGSCVVLTIMGLVGLCGQQAAGSSNCEQFLVL
jgi:hypothetical protein